MIIVYDALGNRIFKKVGSTTNLYLIDDRNLTGYVQVLEELTVTASTNLSRQYTYGLDLISQRQPTTSTNFFGYDGLGSTRFLANSAGANVNTLTYDAYGTLINSNAAPLTAYLYGGEQWDNDLGLYFLRARYLKPNTGRFWTMDTFEGNHSDPLSLHKHLFAGDDPVNRIDPSGHDYTYSGTSMSTLIIGTLAALVFSPDIANAPGPSDPKFSSHGDVDMVINIVGGHLIGKAIGFGVKGLNGAPFNKEWKTPTFYVEKPLIPKPNFFNAVLGIVCDEKAREIAGGTMEMAGEFLPIKVEGEKGEYWIFNITNTINVVDHKKSVWQEYGPVQDDRILTKPAFIPSRFGDETIFKIIEDRGTRPYCVEFTGDPDDGEFKAVVEHSGLTGLDFKLIWTDEK